MAAVPLLIGGGLGLAGMIAGKFMKKKKGDSAITQAQQQMAGTSQSATDAEKTAPAAPQSAAQDQSSAVLAGAQAAQKVRRSAIASKQRRPATPTSTALRAPSLIAG